MLDGVRVVAHAKVYFCLGEGLFLGGGGGWFAEVISWLPEFLLSL